MTGMFQVLNSAGSVSARSRSPATVPPTGQNDVTGRETFPAASGFGRAGAGEGKQGEHVQRVEEQLPAIQFAGLGVSHEVLGDADTRHCGVV